MANFSPPMFASYWVPGVDCSGRVTVPLTDILKYPHTGIVFLAFGRFCRTLPQPPGTPVDPKKFDPACVSIDNGILQQLILQQGQTVSAVRQLQAAGIKVLLSVVGDHTGLGWHTMPYATGPDRFANMVAFAQWVTELIEICRLDGIDIDDEFDDAPPHSQDAQCFMDTVGILRHFMSGKLLTKALWADADYFQITVSPDAPYNKGAKLSSLLDLGCTMAYGLKLDDQKNNLKTYRDYGMSNRQLCLGVQAGTWEWTTPLPEVSELASWIHTSSYGPALGMMLWTFTQDVHQCTQQPPHEWQKTIVEGMWGSGNWKILD